MMEDIRKDDSKYLKGTENWFIRAYFYCSNGLAILNEFRNMFLGIFAVYITFKLASWWWLIVMAIFGIIVMTLTGYVVVHKVNKIKEWLGIRFGSHYGLKTFDYNEDNNKLLTEIRDLLKK